MVHTIAALLIAGLAWLAREVVGEALGMAASGTTRPLRVRVWRACVEASWPWPLLLILVCGVGAAAVGWSQVNVELPDWRRLLGLAAFMSGAGIILFGVLFWRDARRERERQGSRPAV